MYVRLLEPSFGGINLEDIAQPKCLRVLDALRASMTSRTRCAARMSASRSRRPVPGRPEERRMAARPAER
jgi:hypothetical protein